MPERARGFVGRLYGSGELRPDEDVIEMITGERREAAERERREPRDDERDPLEPLGETGPRGSRAVALAERELDVVTLLAEGLTPDDVAGRLMLSPATVRGIVADVRRRAEAAARSEPRDAER